MKIAIVGAEEAKFTEETQRRAKACIQGIICKGAGIAMGESYRPKSETITIVSGHCHLGGIDIWAEHIGMELGCQLEIYPPKKLTWDGGYRDRNIQIAKACDEIHNIVVTEYHPKYVGMRFKSCYHCLKRGNSTLLQPPESHVKSGGCWTAWLAAENFHKPAFWHII